MARKIRQYSNPFLKAKGPLLAPEATAPPILLDAIALHQQGMLGQAEARYRQLLEIEPRNADALHLLGVIAYQAGRYQSSVDMIDQAIEINSNVASYHSNRGNALKELKQLDAAVASYDKAIALKPDLAEAFSNRGNALKELKQLDAAVASYDKAIALKPGLAEAHYNLGIALQELRQLDAAVASYDKAIALKSDYAEAYYNRGNALQELKQFDAAVASYSKAIALKPDYAEAYSNRGIGLQELKQFDAAVASYSKAIALKPDYAEAYLNRGIALQELKLFEAAVASFDKAIALKPDYAEAYSNRGNALKELKQLDHAVASYDKAIALKPDYAEAYSNRGIALEELKQLDAAVASYDKAIALKSDYAEAYSNRGNALKQLKQLDAAFASFDRAIVLKPDLAEAYSNRGNALKELKQLDAAVASYDKAIALKPNYAEAYSNRGIALQEHKQLDAAVASYDKAIALKPDYAEAYYNRGVALKELKQLDVAVVSFDNSFDINPEVHYLLGERQHARMFVCDWSNFAKNLFVYESEIASNKPATTPFIALTLVDKPELHLQSSKIYTESKHSKNQALGKIAKRNAGGKLRLGYFSADLYYHPVAIWLAEQIENHDKSKFELFAFSFRSDIKDPMTARLESAFDHFIDVDKMSDLEVAQLSRQLGIDIAIDLTGYTGGSRTDIFALQAAPIQVSNLGFPGSMGAEYIDYVIADEHLLPESSAKYYTEKIAYVPCGHTYDRQRQLSSEPLSRAQFGLPEKGFVFTCQNGCQKFQPEVFGIWMDILKAVPASVLWLTEPHPSAMANLIKEAQARGVDSDRLVFTKRETVAVDQERARIGRYLASYKLADLFLDTWPYNAGTTAVDALWAGLPVLTKAGEAMVARLATSALHAIEVPELITNTAQEYRDLAIELAGDPRRLKLLTDKLQANRLTSALFDPVGNTRHIEAAYLEMYRRYQADLPPDDIRQYTNPFLKSKGPLFAPEASSLPNLLDAIALHQQGMLGQAEAIYRQLLEIEPRNADALHLLGVITYQAGRHQSSVDMIDQAIEINSNVASYHSNRGNALKELKQLAAAVASYDKAIALKPDYAEAYSNRGNALKQLKELDAAVASYDKAIALKPDLAEAYYNRGNALKELKQLDAAVASYDKAIALKPDYAQAYNNLGAILQEMGRLDEAEVSYRRAIEIEPDLAAAHSNLGDGLRELRRYDEAIKFTTKAIQLNPKLAEAQQAHASMLAHVSDFSDVVKHSNEAVALSSDNPKIWESRLFCYIYHPDLSAQEINAEHVRWGTRFPTLDEDIFDLHDRSPSRRLRVGYVSPDFREHSCRFFFEPLFSHHDHTQFELFAYSNVLTEDEHTQRFKTYFDEWRDILGVSDQEVVEMMRRDRIDILVDACGHMQNNRLAVFTHKPAPIQLTWEGYSWTTGLKQMDYVLFDPYMAPPGTLAIEEIIRLPTTRTVFRPGERAVNEPVKSLPALKKGNVTFGYSGRTERLNYKVFNAWGKILERLPTAQLVLDYKVFSDATTEAYYRDFLAQHGIDVDRVTMRNSSNIFEGLGDIDILLDSFPHNGGTMIFDALWMGVPALTLASRPPVGRIGASVMTNIGLSDWVAKDEYEYVDKAESFAKNVEELARLRASMRERMKASPLMDEAGFARDVESAFKDMWHRWCSGSKLSDKVSDVDEIKIAKSKSSSEQDE